MILIARLRLNKKGLIEKRLIIGLVAEIGRSLLNENRFTLDILSTSIDNLNYMLHRKETELENIKYKLANQQNAMGKLDFHYSQFRTCADELVILQHNKKNDG